MTAPSRVLVATDAVGGVWTYSVELSRALAAAGVETILAVMGPSPDQSKLAEVAAGVRVIDTGLPLDWLAEQPDHIHSAGRWLAVLAAREAADIVQLHSAALAADVRFDQPVVAVQHSCVATWWQAVRRGPLPSDFRWRRDLVEAGLNTVDAAAAPTAAFAAQTARAYGLGRPVYAVHNGRTPVPLGSRSREDFVFTVGRLWDDGKNVSVLDRAAGRIAVTVEAIGPLYGPNGTAVRFENLHTPGPLPPAGIAKRLSARPIYVSSALYEPFGLSALEAAQAGCALILSDIPPFRELWEGAALFVPPTEADAFADAINALLADPERREALGKSAQLRALRYTPAAMAQAMLGLYARLERQPCASPTSVTMAAGA